ncbi:hypothetical protein ABKN59_010926 [Abortiporus biennis]
MNHQTTSTVSCSSIAMSRYSGVQVFIQGQLFGGPYQSLDGFRTGMHNTISNSYWTLDLRSLRVQTRPNSGFARKEERGLYDASEFTSLSISCLSGQTSAGTTEKGAGPFPHIRSSNIQCGELTSSFEGKLLHSSPLSEIRARF